MLLWKFLIALSLMTIVSGGILSHKKKGEEPSVKNAGGEEAEPSAPEENERSDSGKFLTKRSKDDNDHDKDSEAKLDQNERAGPPAHSPPHAHGPPQNVHGFVPPSPVVATPAPSPVVATPAPSPVVATPAPEEKKKSDSNETSDNDGDHNDAKPDEVTNDDDNGDEAGDE